MEKHKDEHWDRYHEIGTRIARCRKYRQMTQDQLAEQVYISRQHMGAIEAPNVKRKLSLDLLFDIAEVLGVEPNYFLEWQERPLAEVMGKNT